MKLIKLCYVHLQIYCNPTIIYTHNAPIKKKKKLFPPPKIIGLFEFSFFFFFKLGILLTLSGTLLKTIFEAREGGALSFPFRAIRLFFFSLSAALENQHLTEKTDYSGAQSMLRRECVQMVSYMQDNMKYFSSIKGNVMRQCQCSLVLIEMSMGSASSPRREEDILCIFIPFAPHGSLLLGIFFFYI